jgi:hypothetical protein
MTGTKIRTAIRIKTRIKTRLKYAAKTTDTTGIVKIAAASANSSSALCARCAENAALNSDSAAAIKSTSVKKNTNAGPAAVSY